MQPVKIITADDLDVDIMKQDLKKRTSTYGAQENSTVPKSSEKSCAICLGELSTEASAEIVNCHHGKSVFFDFLEQSFLFLIYLPYNIACVQQPFIVHVS